MPTCPCDVLTTLDCLQIPPGLTDLPRQYLVFGDFTERMKIDIAAKPELAGWSAAAENDLGVMLLEMWAYVLDVSQFYDARIADETYLLTCKRDVSATRIVRLLGYKPRPALSAVLTLVAETDGIEDVIVPEGSLFRSEGFDTEPPQEFQLLTPKTLKPAYNFWELAPITNDVFPGRLLLDPRESSVPRSGVLVITENGQVVLSGNITSTKPYIGPDEKRYQEVFLDESLEPLKGKILADLNIYLLGLTAAKAIFPIHTSPPSSLSVLDGIYTQIIKDNPAVIEQNGKLYGFQVKTVTTAQVIVGRADNNNNGSLTDPGDIITAAATAFEANFASFPEPNLNNAYRMHFNPIRVGKLVAPAKTLITIADIRPRIPLLGPSSGLENLSSPATFLLTGQKNLGIEVDGEIDRDTVSNDYSFTLKGRNTVMANPLLAPLKLYGNLISVVRGKAVKQEILGSSDASIPNNRFTFKKQPLSWVEDSGPTTTGARPLLEIYVNGVRWHRVNSLYAARPQDQVYIIEIDEAGDSWIVFGDGVRGERPSTGVNNIVADYSFGAGAAKPPPGTVEQIATPIKGLKRITNPAFAQGGRDPETAKNIKINAPGASLNLGRAVSIQDFEALTRGYAGVLNATAEWTWDERQQRGIVNIWIIHDGGVITKKLENWLRSMAAPDMPIAVRKADTAKDNSGALYELLISLKYHPDYIRDTARQNVIAVLMNEETGLLNQRNVPIGGPIYRSILIKAIQSVAGIDAVSSLRLAGSDMPWAINPKAGEYFNFTDNVRIV